MFCLRRLCYLGFVVGFFSGFARTSDVQMTSNLPYMNATFGQVLSGRVSRTSEDLWMYEYTRTKNLTQAVRLQVSSINALTENPVVIVARLQKGVLSWSIPMMSEESHPFYFASRTLCPNLESSMSPTKTQYFHVHVASASLTPINYTLKAFFVEPFELKLKKPVSLSADPAQPVYQVFNFDISTSAVRIKFESNTQTCAILSIQGTQCPVYDLARNVEFTGYYQTVTTKGAITIQKTQMKQFYVVVIVKSTDNECQTGQRSTSPIAPRDKVTLITDRPADYISHRTKVFTITVEPVQSVEEHIPAIALPVVFFGMFYLAAFAVILGIWCKQRANIGKSFLAILMPKKTTDGDLAGEDDAAPIESPLRERSAPLAAASHAQYGAIDTSDSDMTVSPPTGAQPEAKALLEGTTTTDGWEKDYDMLHDLEHEKDIYRLRTGVTLSDLAKKKRKHLKKKYRLYHWNLVVIAVFYTLPVVQLVITYQKVLNSSGDQDICYYNFFCAHPAGVLSAFNNVYSNIGYVMLGILFFFLVLRRDRLHRQAVAANDLNVKHNGIPQHYQIFYAMAMALVMEGVLSACYHVCPNNSNFQFDTSFMYIITCLGMVKVYQTRHPDIAASAHSVYASFAAIILIAVVGMLFASFTFWLVFCIIHITVCLYVSSQLYYMGRVKFAVGSFFSVFHLLRYDCCACPTYKDRMLLLLIANIVNWALSKCSAINGVVNEPRDFATYLLAILIVNGLLYIGFYVIMKLRNKERILPLPFVVSGLSLLCWIAALVFFFKRLTSWQESPAHSREGNSHCLLMGFYDDHDVWHFLSACAMFFSFLALLTLDDDLQGVPRTRIPVF
ncbi:SID1 transmembrane family member 1 [Nematostella vectensis]|uniref:SID1 transmembrane family member 1 n=1 Tax=Nematostella vectensis TaxID=45351 RepID=UPI0020771B9B|nr:SID1 transmembrane family member 1 [Nematostella vectensis]